MYILFSGLKYRVMMMNKQKYEHINFIIELLIIIFSVGLRKRKCYPDKDKR